MTAIASTASGGWKPEELDLRKKEVKAAIGAKRTQIFVSFFTALTVTVAAFAAYESYQSLKATTANNSETAQANQLGVAINALGASDAAERVAGLVLLRVTAGEQISDPATTSPARKAAYDAYLTSLSVLASYIRTYSLQTTRAARNTDSFGLGYGEPAAGSYPIDLNYAADQVKSLLASGHAVKALRKGKPSLDLSGDELYGQSWPHINFSWLKAAYLVGIDLRAANLIHSSWGRRVSLQNAHFQCANLKGAIFRGANLENADFRGANVEGADFRGAKMSGAQMTYLYGSAKGIPPGISVASWKGPGDRSCIKRFSDAPPVASPSATPAVSPVASPSASPAVSPVASPSASPAVSPVASPSASPAPSH